jgi:hypothetical protein
MMNDGSVLLTYFRSAVPVDMDIESKTVVVCVDQLLNGVGRELTLEQRARVAKYLAERFGPGTLASTLA